MRKEMENQSGDKSEEDKVGDDAGVTDPDQDAVLLHHAGSDEDDGVAREGVGEKKRRRWQGQSQETDQQ